MRVCLCNVDISCAYRFQHPENSDAYIMAVDIGKDSKAFCLVLSLAGMTVSYSDIVELFYFFFWGGGGRRRSESPEAPQVFKIGLCKNSICKSPCIVDIRMRSTGTSKYLHVVPQKPLLE